MTFLEDIISAGRGAVESGAQWLDENTALGSHRRNADRLEEISRIAAEQGFISPMQPEFRQQNPELAEEFAALGSALTQVGALGSALTQVGATAPALPAGGGALVAARGIRPSSGAGTPPPQAGVPHPQGPQGGYVPSQAANPPGAASPQGPLGPMPGRVNGGIPMPGAAPAPSPGILGRARNAATTARSNMTPGNIAIGAGVLAASAIPVLAGQGFGSAAAPSYGQVADGYGPGTPVTEGAWKAEEGRKAKADTDARRAREARGDEADIGLTEAQAAYYQAQREKALRELANDDLSEQEKLELAHEYALAEVQARAEAERGNIMIREAGENERTATREAGENERTATREAGEDRRTTYRGDIDMRGQDQRAREAQDAFVTNWLQNQIANGQLSLDRATNLMTAYENQRKLPSEILDKVSQAVARMEQYRTTVNPGQAPPGFEAGGVMAGLSKMAGVKFDPKQYIAQTPDDNWLEIARRFGAEPSNTPMPTVDQVFQGAGQGADMSPEGVEAIRGASASSTQLPRPDMGMPDDVQQRIMAGLR